VGGGGPGKVGPAGVARSGARPVGRGIASNGSPDGHTLASWMPTIDGCCRRAVIRASRSNRRRAVSRSVRTSLRATSRPSRRSRAIWTRPMPPRAISREIT